MRWLLRTFSRLNLWVYRRTGGRLLSRWKGKKCVGILTYRGRRSGQWRSTPLLYLQDGQRLVLIASNLGMSQHPKWYRCLLEHPQCAFEIDRHSRAHCARPADAHERQFYWPRLVALYGGFDRYQARVTREIPVLVLEPTSG